MKDLDVTVIIPGFDDEQTHSLVDLLQDQEYKVKIKVEAGTDRNFAQKCNQAADRSETKYILFLNNDTEPETDMVKNMLASFERDDEWIVTPQIRFKKTVIRHVIFQEKVQHIYGVKEKVQCAGVDFNYQGIPYEFGRLSDPDGIGVRFRRRCLAATGCCFLIERQRFLDLGGFDESFVNGWEDNDFMLRVLEAGGVCVYEPSALLRHLRCCYLSYILDTRTIYN